jgi:hypothetical protein
MCARIAGTHTCTVQGLCGDGVTTPCKIELYCVVNV